MWMDMKTEWEKQKVECDVGGEVRVKRGQWEK